MDQVASFQPQHTHCPVPVDPCMLFWNVGISSIDQSCEDITFHIVNFPPSFSRIFNVNLNVKGKDHRYVET